MTLGQAFIVLLIWIIMDEEIGLLFEARDYLL